MEGRIEPNYPDYDERIITIIILIYFNPYLYKQYVKNVNYL